MLTDLYELTMMQGYWSAGRSAEEASFELFFRSVPEHGGYCIAAGIEDGIELVANTRFRGEELDYLASLNLFQPAFLDYLRQLRFTGELRSVADGSVVFPNEPILEIRAPLIEAQWFETLLLNCINFQTLIATKASRIVQSAKPATIVEFGLRRAQGPNGGLSASKAAYLAGCIGTSNVEAGFMYGIPLYGTHAHSWVMSFPTEEEAYRSYAQTFPDNCLFLIDTYDTLNQGLPKAIAEAKRIKAAGYRPLGIRLDSGDLAYLSKACRAALDAEGLPEMKILASGDVDEYVVRELKTQEAAIDIYGVGTRLATAYQEPAFNGVYKINAIRSNAEWQPKIKISSNPAKTTIPGRKQVWRWESAEGYQGDALTLIDESAPTLMRHPDIDYKQTSLPTAELRPLLETRLRNGDRVIPASTVAETRGRIAHELSRLPMEHQRLANPHLYRIGLSDSLWNLRRSMIAKVGAG